MGRKRKGGERFPGGKLRPTFDRGAEHVQRLRDRFARFHDGKAAQQVHDPIGRAWAVGLLENEHVDPAVLRDCGRNYAALYWGYYPSLTGVANYEREDRRGCVHSDLDRAGEQFRLLDRMLADAGRAAYVAAQSLCLDFYWFSDDNPAWLDRLINLRLLKARLPVAGQLATESDHDRLVSAVSGLLALSAGMPGTRAAA